MAREGLTLMPLEVSQGGSARQDPELARQGHHAACLQSLFHYQDSGGIWVGDGVGLSLLPESCYRAGLSAELHGRALGNVVSDPGWHNSEYATTTCSF